MNVETKVISLNGEWRLAALRPITLPYTDTKAWLPAAVPGHVHTDLFAAGVIPDPFARMHEWSCAWVDEQDWVYERDFVLAEVNRSHRWILRFSGLDTLARIVLNGAEIGRTENMFVPHEFEITEAVQTGANLLRVEFASAKRVSEAKMAAYLPGEIERGWAARSFIRKAQCHYGWDWGPSLIGCGIWRGVELLRVPQARILRWSYDYRFEPDGSCVVAIKVRTENRGAGGEARVVLRRMDRTMEAVARVDKHGLAALSLRIADPDRWWPHGMGEAALYDVELVLGEAGEIWDRITARLGLRELDLIQDPDKDGSSFYFRVNGRPFFAKGANWIPADSFPARVTADDYRRQLKQAIEANMNMLRVWGGGLYETEEFYGLCDELGILVWQDFPFACARYPESLDFQAAIREEATIAVRRLRNHPSLAIYCGNNENHMGAYSWWHVSGEEEWGRPVYHEVLPAVCEAEDPARPYWPSSPYGGEDPNCEGIGDRHDWDVWHGAGDWKNYAADRGRFVSEFGFLAPANRRTWEEYTLPADQAADSPVMRWHNKSGKEYRVFLDYIGLHFPVPQCFEDLVYYGQLNQAEALKYGVEHWRRQWPHCGGTLIWQLNDCWPVHSWALVDYARRPKASWYYARRFFAPILLSPVREGGDLLVYLINEHPGILKDQLAVRAVRTTDGCEIWRREAAVEAGADVSLLLREHLPADVLANPREVVIGVELLQSAVDNTLLLAEPKEMLLADPGMTFSAREEGGGVMVALTVERPALGVELELTDLEAAWEDNFFNLLPGRTYTTRPKAAQPLSTAQVVAALRWRRL